MEHATPTLEYRKPPDRKIRRSFGVAGGHYLGLTIGAIATFFIGLIVFPSYRDPEAIGLMPIIVASFAGIYLIPSFFVWGAMALWSRLTARIPSGNYWFNALLASAAANIAALMCSEIPEVDEFLDRPAFWTYWLAAWFLIPLGFHLILTRKVQDVDPPPESP